jgi:hypothetical protein
MRVILPKKLPNHQQSRSTSPVVLLRHLTAPIRLQTAISLPYRGLRFYSSNSTDKLLIPNDVKDPFAITEQQKAFGKAVNDTESLEDLARLLAAENVKDKEKNKFKSLEKPQGESLENLDKIFANIKPKM